MAEKVRILAARPHRLLAPLIEELGRLNRQEKSVVLLVPEQASHETERRLCAAGGSGTSLYAEVLSFTRLASRVKDSTSAYRLAVSPPAAHSRRSVSWLMSSGTIRMRFPFLPAMSAAMRFITSSRLAVQSVPSKRCSIRPPPSLFCP